MISVCVMVSEGYLVHKLDLIGMQCTGEMKDCDEYWQPGGS